MFSLHSVLSMLHNYFSSTLAYLSIFLCMSFHFFSDSTSIFVIPFQYSCHSYSLFTPHHSTTTPSSPHSQVFSPLQLTPCLATSLTFTFHSIPFISSILIIPLTITPQFFPHSEITPHHSLRRIPLLSFLEAFLFHTIRGISFLLPHSLIVTPHSRSSPHL